MYIAESKGALRELLACSTCAIAMRVALVAREKKSYHLRHVAWQYTVLPLAAQRNCRVTCHGDRPQSIRRDLVEVAFLVRPSQLQRPCLPRG